MSFQNKGLNLIDIEIQNRFSKKATFLSKVDKIIKWGPINKTLKEKYKKKMAADGRPAYHPLSMFKILLIQSWYNLSDEAVEEALYDRISFMKFTNLSITDSIPDHSTICRFRNTLNDLNLFERLFLIINNQLEKQKLLIKKGGIVDASVISSSRRPRKIIKTETVDRQEPDLEENAKENPQVEETEEEKQEASNPIEYSSDTDAKWIVKGKKCYYGYKCHMSVDVNNGFILGGHITPANVSDMNQLDKVLESSNLPKGSPVFADKGYSSKKNRNLITDKGLTDFIMYKKSRNKQLTEIEKSLNKLISKYRYKVEQGFGTLKRRFNFSRMRYLGLQKCQGEFLLKAMCFNILKAVKLAF